MTDFYIGQEVRLIPDESVYSRIDNEIHRATGYVRSLNPWRLEWRNPDGSSRGTHGHKIAPESVEPAHGAPRVNLSAAPDLSPLAERLALDEWISTPPTTSEAAEGASVQPEGASRAEALTAERGASYGHPAENFANIGGLWSAYLSSSTVDPENLTPEDVGHLMILLKVARNTVDTGPDSLDDIEGYAECNRMIREVGTG